jgi:hypothetical protein
VQTLIRVVKTKTGLEQKELVDVRFPPRSALQLQHEQAKFSSMRTALGYTHSATDMIRL